MPIIYVHGVANRDADAWKPVAEMLRRYVTDQVSPQHPDSVEVIPVYWGPLGAQFAWHHKSRPRTVLTGQGAESVSVEQQAQLLAEYAGLLSDMPAEPTSASGGGRLTAGRAGDPSVYQSAIRLKNLSADQLSDLLVAVIDNQKQDEVSKAWAAIAADEIAQQQQVRVRLEACNDLVSELKLIQQLVEEAYKKTSQQRSGLAAQGAGWLTDLSDRLREALGRVSQSPGYALSQVVGELRPKLNEVVTLFFGDVFAYLARRGNTTNLGAIPLLLLDALSRAAEIQKLRPEEPIVVLSHSMGGQIVYDMLTAFLPSLPQYSHVRVDFWCATASQVGLFEEQKLFVESSPLYGADTKKNVPFPDKKFLGYWWNVWDHNDILSYSVKGIITGVDDEPYSSGMSILGAHSGYLLRPSFYRKFADKLAEARKNNWQ